MDKLNKILDDFIDYYEARLKPYSEIKVDTHRQILALILNEEEILSVIYKEIQKWEVKPKGQVLPVTNLAHQLYEAQREKLNE